MYIRASDHDLTSDSCVYLDDVLGLEGVSGASSLSGVGTTPECIVALSEDAKGKVVPTSRCSNWFARNDR